MNNNELEAVIRQANSDIKSLYEMHKEAIEKLRVDIESLKTKESLFEIKVLDKPSETAHLEYKFQELNILVFKLIDILQKIAIEKEIIKPKKPQEELAEIIAEVQQVKAPKEEAIKGFCLTCMEDVNLTNIQDYKDKTGMDFKQGECLKCGSKIYKKIK